jgi:hypothetical protein
VYRGELLLGGSVGPDFNSDPSLFGGLVRWNANTSTFSQFGDNFFGAPFAMMPFGNSLFVGGHIVAVGPESALIPSPFIARWTGCCGPADIGGEGGAETPDGILDNNDFVVFINLFFSSDAGADLGSEGGAIGSDGSFDNNDFIVFIVFIQFFFEGC